MKILIAEDDPVSRLLLDKTLRKWGYDVTAVEDGEAAWKILKNEKKPSIAILDWMMPKMDGPTVIQKIRKTEHLSYYYLILLTSKKDQQDVIMGLDAGADDYLIKPFNPNELKVRLRAGRRIINLLEELFRARELLKEKASYDSLTRLYNRGAIMEILSREIARSHRENLPLGLMMIDLDYFKNINDTYGHMAGDAVLSEIAKVFSENVRPYDFVGRYGGEEFIIILPGCNYKLTLENAHRLLEKVREQKMNIPEGILKVTGSFGVASTEFFTNVTAENFIKTVDGALYVAKRKGRNRVEVALPENTKPLPDFLHSMVQE